MGPASIHFSGLNNGLGMGSATGGIHPSNEECGIREVWAHNMEEEFKTICQVVRDHDYIAMDTEFPGVVARPIGEFKSSSDYQYQLLRCNVDLLKIIQLGVTFMDDEGNLPEGITTWQFNFKFNLTEDMYAEDSVDLLQNSGIQFDKHEQEGIDPMHFAEMMLVSGLVLMDNVKWLSFHSGYDFGYLINLLTNQNLPKSEGEFFELLKTYFPNVYDVKYLMKSCKNLKGGLQEVANELEVRRIGPQHQAGSDALLTGQTFFRMKEMFFEDDIDDSKYCGHLFGLGTSYVVVAPASTNNTNQSPPITTASSTLTPATTASATTTAAPEASSSTVVTSSVTSSSSSLAAVATVTPTTTSEITSTSSASEISSTTSTATGSLLTASSLVTSLSTTDSNSTAAAAVTTSGGGSGFPSTTVPPTTTATEDISSLNSGGSGIVAGDLELTSSSDILSQDSSTNNVESSSA